MEIDVDVSFGLGQMVALPVGVSFLTQPSGLAAAAQVGGGTFAAATYYWVVTGTDAAGETTASNEATATIALNGSCILTWNALAPNTTGVKVYRGTAPGAENALIATLGAVTTYTDTGTAGSGATPPVTNTAEIGDDVILSGQGAICGWSLRETSGTAKAVVEIQDVGSPLGESVMAAGTTDTQIISDSGVLIQGRINVHAVSGVFTGVVYVRYIKTI